ncbi:T9SS type A sorting domain-containing protein [Emticicia soli]|uniref:T9SS type A sorting domain-containing protein n=1 Tax=Emticicia soli TaxID=2027878 RepID=A0ABW5J5B5_9BACT
MKTTAFLKDSQGKVIQKQNLQEGNLQEFDIEKLKDGIYFVELHLGNGKSITHQLYINH